MKKMQPVVNSEQWEVFMDFLAEEQGLLFSRMTNASGDETTRAQGEAKYLEKLKGLKDYINREVVL
jgi:hypothetical protein